MTPFNSNPLGCLKRPLLALATALAAQVALAGPEAGSWNLNPSLGGQWYDDGRSLKPSALFGLGVEYGISPSFSVELGYWQGSSDRERLFITIDPANLTFQEVRLDALYHVNPIRLGPITPYLVGGLGYGRFSVDNDTIWEDARVNFGPGLSLQLGESWRVLGDVRLAHGLGDGDLDVVSRVGISYRLWPRPARAEAPVERAAPAPAPAEPAVAPEPAPASAEPAPAPVTAAPVTEVVEERLVQAFVTRFDTNKSNFNPGDAAALAELAAFLEAHPQAQVVIVGHTDNTGPTALNERLAVARAESVAQQLRSRHGIAANRIVVQGMGYRQPVATNRTEEGKALNRRAEAEAEVIVEVEVSR